jgi:hypothetical protein
MLKTPTQRLSLLLLVCGSGVFVAGIYQWLQDHRHHWVLSTRYIPDYPFNYMGFSPAEHDGFIQRHRACEWTSNIASVPVSDEDKQWLDHGMPAGPVVQNDLFLTVDGACAKQEISSLEPKALHYSVFPSAGAPNPYWNARLATGFWSYANVLIDKSLRSGFWWGPAEPQKSGQELYKEQLQEELRQTGYNFLTASTIAEKCTKAERKWCVETARSSHLRFWTVTKSDPLMLSGTALIFLGLAGSVFYSPLRWLTQRTIGRVYAWVTQGK